jgi:NADPH:quinone reductase-like Zn-dependent oxidoreductase
MKGMDNMKAWQFNGFGLENLKKVELPTPTPGPKEILVRVKAVSLNYRDKAIVDGIYMPELMKPPFVPVADASGEVVSVGAEVTKFKEGDRVTSHMFTEWVDGKPSLTMGASALGGPNNGGLAEYMILKEDTTVKTPDNMTDEEASTLPIAALTVWMSLVEFGKIKAGETVLVQGTGGVSVYAIQIASALGARVIATSSSNEKLERVKTLGATDVINYKETPAWEEEVLKLTNGEGVNHILEVVGGEGVNQSIEALTLQGNIYVIGFLNGLESKVNLFALLAKQAKIHGINVGHRRAFDDMSRAFEQLQIKPVIDTVYSFDQAIEAYEHLYRGAFGKIVIKVAD